MSGYCMGPVFWDRPSSRCCCYGNRTAGSKPIKKLWHSWEL